MRPYEYATPGIWFPPGWNLEYDLPEGDIPPGYGYEMQYWTHEERKAWKQDRDAKAAEGAKIDTVQSSKGTAENPTPDSPHPGNASPMDEAAEKLRPNQEARIACQQIAKAIWNREPDRTIASVVKDELIQVYGGGSYFVEETVREWVKAVAPQNVRDRRGRPSKKGAKEN